MQGNQRKSANCILPGYKPHARDSDLLYARMKTSIEMPGCDPGGHLLLDVCMYPLYDVSCRGRFAHHVVACVQCTKDMTTTVGVSCVQGRLRLASRPPLVRWILVGILLG